MRKPAALLLALCIATGLFAGCGMAAPQNGSQSAVAPTLFVDDAARTVEIPHSPSAIVPSGPGAQMVLVTLAPEMLVGLSSKYSGAAAAYLPISGEALAAIPVLGALYNNSDLNIEALMLTGARLIIDLGETKSTTAEDLDGLAATTGIPAVHLNTTFTNMPAVYRTLGNVLNCAEKAEQLAVFCEKTLAAIEEITASGVQKPTFLYLQGEDGLHVIAKGVYHAELMDTLGENLAVLETPTAKGTGNEVDFEQILLWDPEILLLAPDFGIDNASLAGHPLWGQLSAVQNGRVYRAPSLPYNWLGFPAGVNRYLGAWWLMAVFYPETASFNLNEKVREYFELFFSCNLSEQECTALISGAN